MSKIGDQCEDRNINITILLTKVLPPAILILLTWKMFIKESLHAVMCYTDIIKRSTIGKGILQEGLVFQVVYIYPAVTLHEKLYFPNSFKELPINVKEGGVIE